MTARRLFYFCEIAARLDSGMTLQVAHDYGRLAGTGWQVALPVSVSDEAEWDSFVQLLRQQGNARTIRLRARWRAARLASMAFAAWRHRADVIVMRERRHLAAARLVRRLSGALLVSELHEGAFPRADDAASRRRFARFLARLDGVVFTNASQREYLAQLGYVPPLQQVVLPNGVDYQRFSGASPAPDGAPFVLTYTGQFTTWKNFELLFAALGRLDERFRLRIAGGKVGAESARQVADLARRYRVDGRVEYLGFLHPRDVVARALSGSSVLVLPLGENTVSRYATSPMKLIEYLATGIPVVAVDHPSVVALAGRDAVHLARGEAEAFAAAIRLAALEDAASRRRRAEQARALAAGFDHARRAARFDAWLSQLGRR